MKRLLGLLLAVMVMMGGMAGAQASTDNASMQLIRMNPLAFRKEPVELYSVTHTPNGSFVVIYFAEGEKAELQEIWMELFDSVGTSLLSAKLGEFDPKGEQIPHGQIILKKDRFICEYYPDITSMEVCTQTVYRYTGKRIQKPTIKKLKFGAAPYAQHVGDYMVEKQAHSEDESPFRTVKITHIASGKSKKLMIYDWSFCACSDQDGNLLIAQQNEKGNLEIRSYNAAMQESIVELSGDFLQNSYISDAACIGQTVYFDIYLTNQQSEILFYDITQQKITDSQTLLAVDDNSYIAEIKAAGAVLLSVDGYWNRELQRQKYQINLLNEHFETSRLPLQHESCLYIFTDVEQADITTIEMDEKSHSYFVCSYSITDSNLNHTGIYLYSKGKIMIHLTFDYKTDEKCTTPGQYLKYHRTFQGLTTRELAEKVGIVPATLVLYENDRHPIKHDIAVALANTLGIDRNRLLDEYTAFVDYPYSSLLKKVRHELSLTQMQMAEVIGIGQTTYSGWEREARVPRRKEHDKILAALKKLKVNVDTYICQSASI